MRYLFLLIIMVFYSCNSTNKNKKKTENINREKVVFLKNIITDSHSTTYQVYDTTLFHFDKVLIDQKTQSHCIYLLNSDCSSCLGKFFDFLFYLDATGCAIPVNAIITEENTQIVKFYLSKYNTLNKLKIYFYENKNHSFVKNQLEVENGKIFYFNKGSFQKLFYLND